MTEIELPITFDAISPAGLKKFELNSSGYSESKIGPEGGRDRTLIENRSAYSIRFFFDPTDTKAQVLINALNSPDTLGVEVIDKNNILAGPISQYGQVTPNTKLRARVYDKTAQNQLSATSVELSLIPTEGAMMFGYKVNLGLGDSHEIGFTSGEIVQNVAQAKGAIRITKAMES